MSVTMPHPKFGEVRFSAAFGPCRSLGLSSSPGRLFLADHLIRLCHLVPGLRALTRGNGNEEAAR
jgi:hypothetical protein